MRRLFFLLAVIGACVSLSRGAIVVGANGSGVHSFPTRPLASEWSTKSITGTDVLLANSNDLRNAVQTNATALSINTQLPDAFGANPPGQNTVAAWSSGGTGALWTRPTANGATLLMATLQNATGGDQPALRIAYTLGQSGLTPAEQSPAHQVYYSFSGELGSWINIPGLSGGSVGARSNVVVFATPWTNGAPLYLLWVDDNATGGVDRGHYIDDISFTATTGLELAVIPDLTLDVLQSFLFRVRVTESNGPGGFLYSLDSGAPPSAGINPTNGVFHWRPRRADAGTTNPITIRVTESSGSMLAATQTFNIAVRDYLEFTVGPAVVEVGQRTNVLIQFDSSRAIAGAGFTLGLPTNQLVALDLENLMPSVATATFTASQPDRVFVSFDALPGQFLNGSQQLARLHFTVAPQPSGFIPLPIQLVIVSAAEPGISVLSILRNDGRVVVVNEEPLLESFQTNGVRSLTLYGRPGRNIALETSTNLGFWQFWQSVPLLSLAQPVDASAHTNLPIVLYRALDGLAAPSVQPQTVPVEFKALTKLKKRKLVAALKRQQRMHRRFTPPAPVLFP